MRTDIFLQNKYTFWYYHIILNAKTRDSLIISEEHHVIPESFFINRTRKGSVGDLAGDPEAIENKVLLTPREHLVCHKLLVKMTTGKYKTKMYNALLLFYGNNPSSLTSRQYELLKVQLRERLLGKSYEEIYGDDKGKLMRDEKSIATSGENNPFYNKTHSSETKHKMSIQASKPRSMLWKESASLKRKGRTPFNKGKTFEELYGEERALELKKKVANSGEKNGFFGKSHSDEQRERKRQEKLNAPKKKCKYCNKEVDSMNYSRWHGENCKLKGE